MKMEREEKSEDDAREEKIEGDFLRLDGGCERQSQERRKTTKRGVVVSSAPLCLVLSSSPLRVVAQLIRRNQSAKVRRLCDWWNVSTD
jgi:hypothetical protein